MNKGLTSILIVGMFLIASFSTLSAVGIEASDVVESKNVIEVSIGDSIQEAINNAEPGDTINVDSGEYTGNIVIDKSITLKGEGKSNTTIKSESDAAKYTIQIKSDNVIISDFTIDNIGDGSAGLIILDNPSNNCEIGNCDLNSDSGKAIYISSNSSYNIVDNCNIVFKEDPYFDCVGIHISGDYNTISHCMVKKFKPGVIIDGDNNRIHHCIIRENKDHGIFAWEFSNNNLIYLNNFQLNDYWNAADSGNGNSWYNSAIEKGNYWDDCSRIDTDGDGVGNFYYTKGDVLDKYPLINPPVGSKSKSKDFQFIFNKFSKIFNLFNYFLKF